MDTVGACGILEIVISVALLYKLYIEVDTVIVLLFYFPSLFVIVLAHTVNAGQLIFTGKDSTDFYTYVCVMSLTLIVLAVIQIIPNSILVLGLESQYTNLMFLVVLITEFYAHPFIRRCHKDGFYSIKMIADGYARIAPLLYLMALPLYMLFLNSYCLNMRQTVCALPDFRLIYMTSFGALNLSSLLAWIVCVLCYILNETRVKPLTSARARKWYGCMIVFFNMTIISLDLIMGRYIPAISEAFPSYNIDIENLWAYFTIQGVLVILPSCLLAFRTVRSSFTRPILSPEKFISLLSLKDIFKGAHL